MFNTERRLGFHATWLVVLVLAVSVASYGPAAIIQAVIPDVVPTANKRGTSSVFQLAGSATPNAVGTPFCDDGSGNAVAGNCSPGVNSAALQYSQKTTTNFNTAAVHPILVLANAGVGSVTLPAGVLNNLGQEFYVRAMGFVTTGNTPSGFGSAELIVSFGAVAVTDQTIVLTSLPANTTVPFDLWFQFVTRTTGATGSGIAIGRMNFYQAGTGAMGAINAYSFANQASHVVDFTSSFAVSFSATLSAAVNQWAFEQVTLSYI